MAHFAEIDANNKVLRVLVVPDSEQTRGQQFLANDLLLGSTWIQTSYNGTIRKQFASVGGSYDPVADVFVAPQPFPSWALDANYDWQAPVAYPTDGGSYVWNEKKKAWVVL